MNVSIKSIFANFAMINKSRPIGGVIKPIITFRTNINPN